VAAGVPKPITGRILPDTRPGKRLRNELENHHAMKIGKSTISTGPFSIANCKSEHNQQIHDGFVQKWWIQNNMAPDFVKAPTITWPCCVEGLGFAVGKSR
jgi:hypothetical protein